MEIPRFTIVLLSLLVASTHCEPPEEVIHGVKWVFRRVSSQKITRQKKSWNSLYADKKLVVCSRYSLRYANLCEACKILATELQERLTATGKTHDVIETGWVDLSLKLARLQFRYQFPSHFLLRYLIDGEKKKTKYTKSELRLIESTEDVCEQVLQYNIHKERKDSTRFAKGMSQTFGTLHGLVNKGVKVELGIPYELWDKPSAEITQLKTQCETLKERHEDLIEDWYFNRQDDIALIDFLCRDNVLKKKDAECLYEVFTEKKKGDDDDDEDRRDEDESDVKKSSKKKVEKEL